MTDRDSFVKAICQSPEDDTSRLVFADWLQENGEEDYGEFIRVQCELARGPMFVGECKVCSATPDEEGWIRHGRGCYTQSEDGGGDEAADRNPKWEALRRRERGLLDTPCHGTHGVSNWGLWAKDVLDRIPSRSGVYSIDFPVQFTRGFISSITCTAEDWLQHADALYWHPDQTVECPECHGQPNDGDYAPPVSCRCGATGRIPRPFVATAQPLEKVVVSGIHEGFILNNDFSVTVTDGNVTQVANPSTWKSPKWPGIEFQFMVNFRDVMQRMFDRRYTFPTRVDSVDLVNPQPMVIDPEIARVIREALEED